MSNNTITGEPLRWCANCLAAEDTAKLWKLSCSKPRHAFTLTSKPNSGAKQ